MKNHKICYGYEKVIQKTPHGGDYAEIFYYSKDNEMCEARDASYCVIHERKNNGAVINTLYAYL